MKKSTFSITIMIILFCILTVILQLSSYYFLGSNWITYLIVTVISLLFSHIFLTQTKNFESCFSYVLLNILLYSMILLLLYLGGKNSFIIYDNQLLILPFINWIVPHFYGIIRNLTDNNSRYINFKTFFRNNSLLFLMFYVIILIDVLFIKNTDNILYYTNLKTINYIPFLTLATLIEDFMSGQATLSSIFSYLVRETVFFIPYGFYMILLLKDSSRLLRFISLLFLPLLIEILQRIFLLGKCDLDDILFALLGGFIGGLIYHFLNRIYKNIKDEEFLQEHRHSYYHNSSLHF